jgi:hypothetical protein
MHTAKKLVLASAVVLALAAPSWAIIGVGLHWGFDWSLSLKDMRNEQLTLSGIKLDASASDISGTLPTGIPIEIPSTMLPIYINRTGFDRTVIDFGGKVLIDAIKWFAIELSANFGMWEYEGEIVYPTGLTYKSGVTVTPNSKPSDIFDVTYGTLPVTLKSLGLHYLGMDKTPYAKLNFDLDLRKNLFAFPKKLKTWSVYLGAGPSVHFATPVLSAKLINDVLSDKFPADFQSVQSLGQDFFGDPKVMDAVLNKITDGLAVPRWGMNLLAGTQIKIPIIPLAFYLDGKFMIPFGNLDPYADLKGYGFLVNAGVMLKF